MRITVKRTKNRLSPEVKLWLGRSGKLALAGFGIQFLTVLLEGTPLALPFAVLSLLCLFASLAVLLVIPFLPLLRWIRQRDYEDHSQSTPASMRPEGPALPDAAPIQPEKPELSGGFSEFRQSVSQLSTNPRYGFYAVVALVVLMTGFILDLFVQERVLPDWVSTMGQWMMSLGFGGAFVLAMAYLAARARERQGRSQDSDTSDSSRSESRV